MSGYKRENRNVLRCCLMTASDGAAVTSAGRSFHTAAPEAVNVRLLTVDRRMISTCKRSEPDERSRRRDGISYHLMVKQKYLYCTVWFHGLQDYYVDLFCSLSVLLQLHHLALFISMSHVRDGFWQLVSARLSGCNLRFIILYCTMTVVPRHWLHCWLPSIHRTRPHGLELLAGQPPRTAGLWVL